MSHKLFMEMDDDLFQNDSSKLKVDNLFFDDDMGLYPKNEKIVFYNKLKSEYLRILMIDNYDVVQKRLYGDKTNRLIIEFELTRIKKISKGNKLVLERVNNIEKLLEMYGDDISDDIYQMIINEIIKLELSLNMKIGLFKELCSLYKMINNIDTINNGISYIKK